MKLKRCEGYFFFFNHRIYKLNLIMEALTTDIQAFWWTKQIPTVKSHKYFFNPTEITLGLCNLKTE